jgi:hypothetical protein
MKVFGPMIKISKRCKTQIRKRKNFLMNQTVKLSCLEEKNQLTQRLTMIMLFPTFTPI